MMHSLVVLSAFAATAFGSPHANVRRQVTQLRESYDFIIAGAGTAGLTVADRLTEAFPDRASAICSSLSFGSFLSGTVLVVEYGGVEEGVGQFEPPNSPAPGSRWSYASLPMAALNNRTASLMVGQVVGGSSVINGQFFDRGSKHDYNDWKTLGSPDFDSSEHKWDWDGIAPFFRKVCLPSFIKYQYSFH
jgi:choline dehydrogenase